MRFSRRFSEIVVILLVLSALLTIAPAQVQPVNDYGALGIERLLKRLNTTASVMMIGAHPDDEDSALLAYLARGDNARTAYLSLTRGDGGQNIIGPELFESLGIIRTEELLQARRLDGAEQYFTRAYDYGFSKTLAEAKQKWEKVVLCDAVRAIRLFRPMVVISRFTGTPQDGHGHHQFAGYISPIAVKAAANPAQCTQSGPAWQVLKFYVEQGFGENQPQPTVRINTGQYDPVLGRTYFEIAMEGRSQHRSQGEGRIEFHGDQFSGLNLIDSKAPKAETEKSIFDGIDVTITGISKLAGFSGPEISEDLTSIQNSSEKAFREFTPSDPQKIMPALIDGLNATKRARTKLAQILKDGTDIAQRADVYLARKEAEFSKAIQNVSGVTIDALSDRETVIGGDELFATVKVYFPQAETVKVKDVFLQVPTGWQTAKVEPPKENNQSFNRRETARDAQTFSIRVPPDAGSTSPYWLRDSRDGDLFIWPADAGQTLPFQPPDVVARVTIQIDDTEVVFEQPLQYRFADPARGEIRRDLNVVPALSVSMDKELLVVPYSDKPQTSRVVMNITNNSSGPISGVVSLNIVGKESVDWKYSASSSTFELKTKGEKTAITFEETIPARSKIGRYAIYGQVQVGEGLASQTMNIVTYPHIQTHRFYTRAETDVNILDLKNVPVKVGYIMGSGDDVPGAIRQIGDDLTMLEEKDLAAADLSSFDTIVVGIRASETRPDLIANNNRLMDYVKNGGNLIMQYQRGNFAKSGLPPYPVDTTDKQGTAAGSVSRVTDENASVKILDPQHPVFNFPNKITAVDFAGWVQERNAYNFVTFDAKYTPLLESHDSDEQENKGGLVIAAVGKGTWVYCSYSFFRQLPAGVPGAYRLFANLLSLPKARK